MSHLCQYSCISVYSNIIPMTELLQDNLRTVSMATEGDELALMPGQSLGVDLGIMKEELSCDGTVLSAVSAWRN